MWRNNFNADWERRKEYLIRSLFQDLPPLSPVPEEDESFDSSRSYIDPPLPPFTHEQSYRAPSPLPPLIIEREPNRHDEPEEYYIKLERKMRKIYRKLFIERKSDISSAEISDAGEMGDKEYVPCTSLEKRKSFGMTNDDKELENESHICDLDERSVEKYLLEKSGLLKRTISEHDANSRDESSSKKSKSIDVDFNNDYANTSSTEFLPKSTSDEEDTIQNDTLSSSSPATKEPDTASLSSDTSPTDNSVDHRQVTFKADVHRDATDELEIPSEQSAKTVAEKAMRRDFEDVIDENLAVTLENNGVSDSIHSNIREAEVMRTKHSLQIHHLDGSLHNENHSSSFDDIAMEEVPILLEAHTESTCTTDHRESVSLDVNINFDLLHRISTPIMKEIENGDTIRGHENKNSRRRKRSGSPLSKSSSNETRYEDAEVQTSLDSKREYKGVLGDIFIGTPKVFRLCSCVNHFCD